MTIYYDMGATFYQKTKK